MVGPHDRESDDGTSRDDRDSVPLLCPQILGDPGGLTAMAGDGNRLALAGGRPFLTSEWLTALVERVRRGRLQRRAAARP
jgi:hypothetical protein